MIEQFYEFISEQYEKFIDYELGREYSYFDEMYGRFGKNYLQRLEVDISTKEIELKKTYDLCSKNISDFIDKIKTLNNPSKFEEEYKEWKLDQGEKLEKDFEYSEDFYSYYNDTVDLLWNDLQEDNEYSEIIAHLKNIDYRDFDDLLIKMRRFSEEVDNVYDKLTEFLSLKLFNKNQLIESLFSDEEIDIDTIY